MQDVFEWCFECQYYSQCYENGFASFIEPACSEGPVVNGDNNE